ncbi:MAG: metallophosphoesterase [Gammaproteobacteria bacterium]|nr:metallophosphoesterase [Gammaproteobacteria bacterium]
MKIFYRQCRNTAAAMRSHFLLSLFLLFISISLVGCGASSDSTAEAEGDGEIVIGLTDAEGDFASYTVDVLSLTLTKANGAVVETLPLSTRVDFAQYTEMTEFLTAATVPNGVYVKASMVLDYSDADIWVENAAGDAVKVNDIVDTDGMPLRQLDVAVNLEGRTRLVIAPGIPSHLTLDFDLKASNKVRFDGAGVPTQVVEPFLLADVALERPKIHRLRGPLASVDVENSHFDVILRPFHHRLTTDRHRRFGQLEVVTNNATLFDINGDDYQGRAGLVALDEQPRFTAIIVIGDLKLNPRRFEAREVYAGSSVPGGELDVVTGNVIARNGDSLTVKGVTLIRAGGSVIFNDEVIVNMGDLTQVKRQLSMGTDYDIDDVSVGQRVRVFGVLTNDMTTRLEMDAGVNNRGRVKMRLTTLRGTVLDVVGIPEQPLPFVLDLQAIDGRHIGLFDFSGTGDEPANDADPAFYEIDVATLDMSGLISDTPVKVRGFVRSFGQVSTAAPSDFAAHTIVDVTALKAVMTIGWVPASSTAIAGSSADSLTLSLEGVGRFHHVARARVAIDLTMADTAPRIVPRKNGEGMYRLVQSGVVSVHTEFARFTAELETRLRDGALVKHVSASGPYNDARATITAGLATVVLE